MTQRLTDSSIQRKSKFNRTVNIEKISAFVHNRTAVGKFLLAEFIFLIPALIGNVIDFASEKYSLFNLLSWPIFNLFQSKDNNFILLVSDIIGIAIVLLIFAPVSYWSTKSKIGWVVGLISSVSVGLFGSILLLSQEKGMSGL